MSEFEMEKNIMPKLEVIKVAPSGLGYGQEQGISYEARIEEVGLETMQKIEKAVNSPEILVPVSTDKSGNTLDDDGCGDGRNVARIFQGTEEKTKSLNRAKVFGGGATMALSTLVGLGKAEGRTLSQNFSHAMHTMQDKMIDFGGHTDTHAHGANCGCGAIDKSPVIISNAVKFADQIRRSIEALGVDTNGLDDVSNEYSSYAKEIDGQEYSGADVMGVIIDNGRVVKELDDNHKEMIAVLNMVEGHTVDQEKVREISGGSAQAFAVDVWRVKQIADRLYAGESDEVRHKAFLSELVYTLATAATLTKGDLPVYVVSKQPELVTT